MKKLGFILMAIAAIVVGLLVGTLNSTPVELDLLWIQFELPLGLALLSGFALGLVTGLGMLYISRILPLRFQLRKARAALARFDSSDQQDTSELSLPDD